MANANLLAMIANPNTGDPAAYAKGAQAGNTLMKYRNDAQAQALLPAALGGDKNALAQIAQFSPDLGLRLDDRNYDRSRDAIADRRASAAESRANWGFQRQKAIDKANRVAQVLLSADTPEKHAQAVALLKAQGIGFNPGEDAFENRETLINQALSIEQQIDMRAGPKPMSAAGKVQHDVNAGIITPEEASVAKPGKLTEAQRRNKQLYSVAAPEAETLLGDGTPGSSGTFDALADPANQRAAMLPGMGIGLGNRLVSPEYQQAKNALRTVIATYLYSTSGATANPGEVENQADILTPQWGDAPETVAKKKARIKTMIDSIKTANETATMPDMQFDEETIGALIEKYAP